MLLKTMKIISFVVWTLLLILFLVLIGSLHKDIRKTGKLEDLKVYDHKQSRYGILKREDAIKFGFSQIAAVIRYLLVAASVGLGFLAKLTIEPRSSKTDESEYRYIQPRTLIFLLNAAMGFCLSMLCGLFAQLYFAGIPDRPDFSIYRELGICVFFQAALFFFAVAFMAVPVILTVFSQVSKKSEAEDS